MRALTPKGIGMEKEEKPEDDKKSEDAKPNAKKRKEPEDGKRNPEDAKRNLKKIFKKL